MKVFMFEFFFRYIEKMVKLSPEEREARKQRLIQKKQKAQEEKKEKKRLKDEEKLKKKAMSFYFISPNVALNLKRDKMYTKYVNEIKRHGYKKIKIQDN